MVLKLWEILRTFNAPGEESGVTGGVNDAAADIVSGKTKEGSPKLPDRYKHTHSGKVRETYQHPDDPESLIMIATDRISTHDIIHKGLIPGKWKALTRMANYWFEYFSKHEDTKTIPNQLSDTPFPADFPDELLESAVVVKKLKALPIEAIVRWYLYGSALKWDEKKGIPPYNSETWELWTWEFVWKWLQKCSKFDEPRFTPSTKDDGWDTNVNFETMVRTLQEWLPINGYGEIDARELAEQIKDYSLKMYNAANNHAQEKNLILWDTKFEFGLDGMWKLYVIDEVCTADSSRLWEAETVVEWQEPTSKDKQPVRDYVEQYCKDYPAKDGKKYAVQIIEKIRKLTWERYEEISSIFL